MSIKELAALIGLKTTTIYGLIGRGAIPVQRVRRRVMFAPSAIEAWLATQTHPDRFFRSSLRRRSREPVPHEEAPHEQNAH